MPRTSDIMELKLARETRVAISDLRKAIDRQSHTLAVLTQQVARLTDILTEENEDGAPFEGSNMQQTLTDFDLSPSPDYDDISKEG